MRKDFHQYLNLLFSKKAPELRYYEDELHKDFIIDDNENKINTFPVLEHEERYLSLNHSESYMYLSIRAYGQSTDVVRIKSSALFSKSAYISQFGNKPFAEFDDTSWEIFFTTIKAMLTEVEQRMTYEYSGWNQEFDKYLFGNLLIDANNTLSIQTTLVSSNTLLSTKTDTEVCKSIIDIDKNISDNELIGHIFFMYLLLGHIKQRFVCKHHLCPEFVLSIVGATGSYKTTTSTALFNTCDCSISSFEDTFASIRRDVQANNSGIIIVDDYKISSTQNDAKYEKIVRLSGDVQTSGKYVSGNKVVDELITGMCVITGEKRPQLQQSSYSRILFVDLVEYPINLTYLTKLQRSKADINSFIVLFVKHIINSYDFDNRFIELFKKHRDELLKDTNFKGMHGRYYSMYGWLSAMWDIYVNILKQYGICDEFDFQSEIKNYIYSQNNRYDNNPVKMFATGYFELYASNEIAVIDCNRIDTLNFDVIQYGDKLFIKSKAVYKKVCKFWQDRGIDFPCSEKRLRKFLYDAKILDAHNGKFTTEKKTKDNSSFSGYYIFKNTFKAYGGNDYDE